MGSLTLSNVGSCSFTGLAEPERRRETSGRHNRVSFALGAVSDFWGHGIQQAAPMEGNRGYGSPQVSGKSHALAAMARASESGDSANRPADYMVERLHTLITKIKVAEEEAAAFEVKQSVGDQEAKDMYEAEYRSCLEAKRKYQEEKKRLYEILAKQLGVVTKDGLNEYIGKKMEELGMVEFIGKQMEELGMELTKFFLERQGALLAEKDFYKSMSFSLIIVTIGSSIDDFVVAVVIQILVLVLFNIAPILSLAAGIRLRVKRKDDG